MQVFSLVGFINFLLLPVNIRLRHKTWWRASCFLCLHFVFCWIFLIWKLKCSFCQANKSLFPAIRQVKVFSFFLPGVLSSTLTPFQLTQYTAALLVPSFHKSSNTTLPLSELCWHPVAAYIEIKRLLLACNSTNAPALTSLPSLW